VVIIFNFVGLPVMLAAKLFSCFYGNTMTNSPKTIPISVFIITLNEETNLKHALQSLANIAEIIVVDSGSTDNTVAIAEKYGAKVYSQQWAGYAKQKQYAMSLCSNEWVLNIDADEVLNSDIITHFAAIIAQDKADSVRFWRNDIFIGKKLSSLTKRANNLRFYKKSKAHFDTHKLVHESARVHGKEVFINKEFDHYGYNKISIFTSKNNHYSDLKAQEKYQQGKRYSVIKLFSIFPLIFIKEYLIQRHIFSGRRGFIKSVIIAYYAFSKEAKLFEIEQLNKFK